MRKRSSNFNKASNIFNYTVKLVEIYDSCIASNDMDADISPIVFNIYKLLRNNVDF